MVQIDRILTEPLNSILSEYRELPKEERIGRYDEYLQRFSELLSKEADTIIENIEKQTA